MPSKTCDPHKQPYKLMSKTVKLMQVTNVLKERDEKEETIYLYLDII